MGIWRVLRTYLHRYAMEAYPPFANVLIASPFVPLASSLCHLISIISPITPLWKTSCTPFFPYDSWDEEKLQLLSGTKTCPLRLRCEPYPLCQIMHSLCQDVALRINWCNGDQLTSCNKPAAVRPSHFFGFCQMNSCSPWSDNWRQWILDRHDAGNGLHSTGPRTGFTWSIALMSFWCCAAVSLWQTGRLIWVGMLRGRFHLVSFCAPATPLLMAPLIQHQ